MPGEDVSGDRHVAASAAHGLAIAVIDGLGHGPDAAFAAGRAAEVVEGHPDAQPEELVRLCHEALQRTRGAAITIACDRCGGRRAGVARSGERPGDGPPVRDRRGSWPRVGPPARGSRRLRAARAPARQGPAPARRRARPRDRRRAARVRRLAVTERSARRVSPSGSSMRRPASPTTRSCSSPATAAADRRQTRRRPLGPLPQGRQAQGRRSAPEGPPAAPRATRTGARRGARTGRSSRRPSPAAARRAASSSSAVSSPDM